MDGRQSPTGYLGSNFLHEGRRQRQPHGEIHARAAPARLVQVYARWTAAADRATNVPYTIVHSNGSQTVTHRNQTTMAGNGICSD